MEVNSILKLQPSNKHLKEQIQVKHGKLTTLKDIQNIKTISSVNQKDKERRTDVQVTID